MAAITKQTGNLHKNIEVTHIQENEKTVESLADKKLIFPDSKAIYDYLWEDQRVRSLFESSDSEDALYWTKNKFIARNHLVLNT